jgi:hypothetical protein
LVGPWHSGRGWVEVAIGPGGCRGRPARASQELVDPITELLEGLTVERVVDPTTSASFPDEAACMERPEMVRGEGGAEPKGRTEVADAALAVSQIGDDSRSRRFGDRLESPYDFRRSALERDRRKIVHVVILMLVSITCV